MCQMGDSANILAVGDTISDIHLLDIRKLSAVVIYLAEVVRILDLEGWLDLAVPYVNWSITLPQSQMYWHVLD